MLLSDSEFLTKSKRRKKKKKRNLKHVIHSKHAQINFGFRDYLVKLTFLHIYIYLFRNKQTNKQWTYFCFIDSTTESQSNFCLQCHYSPVLSFHIIHLESTQLQISSYNHIESLFSFRSVVTITDNCFKQKSSSEYANQVLPLI